MFKRVLVFTGGMLFVSQLCLATPTGLNNISTADVVPEKVLVFQTIVDVGKKAQSEYTTGFKYGLFKNLEVGLDGRIFPEASKEETLKGQFKYRFELGDSAAVALGVANLGDRSRLGWEDYYLSLSYDLDFLRVHAGGTLQRDNEGVFGGLDKTFSFFERDFVARMDIIQTNDGQNITSSAGFIYDLGHNFLLESWVSFPTQSGKKNVSTIKLDYVVSF
ncbi:hypothetical protein MNBD_BACTEROID05-876 [hydrothermal vent metagenome]|uniref:Uncharacterized protein n=1 Tax=hydrothermal vent metagenome TaxID=652676 RepID=A0A3B0TN55_9ZZZZ